MVVDVKDEIDTEVAVIDVCKVIVEIDVSVRTLVAENVVSVVVVLNSITADVDVEVVRRLFDVTFLSVSTKLLSDC